MAVEYWKDVKGYEGLYRVSSKGEIYSLISNKILKPFYRGSREDNRYLIVDLHKNGKGKRISVHRIVAEAFIPNPNNLPCINHKDGNKYNNCISNLEWCTYLENNNHAYRTGLKHIPSGTKNKSSKLTYDEVVDIKKCLILGDPKYGARPLGKKYGVDHSVILDIYHNIKYKDVKIPYIFFVCSDIHSAYTPLIKALNEAGFNQNKYNHKIILCGDLFDRMNETQEVYDFIEDMINKDKLIYIRGNHEDLIRDCMQRGYAEAHDYSNGTVNTILELGGAKYGRSFAECCIVAEEKLQPFFDSMVNYFETEHYIFVHSWIPLTNNYMVPLYYLSAGKLEFNPNWRDAYQYEWEDARWGNPLEMAIKGLTPEKCIVSGHWHCSAGWAIERGTSEFGEDAIFDPYYYEDKLIMIDACTAYSKKVNVLVIEDEFLK